MAIDLNKLEIRKDYVIDLKKQKGIADQKAQVVVCLDYSLSMSHLYTDGTVQKTIERLLPLGLAFDDNNEIDFYIFENGVKRLPDTVNLKNIDGYINQFVIKYKMGGTNYSPAINEIVKDFKSKKGLFGGSKPMKLPVYVIFITDGDNQDKPVTRHAISEASKHGIFFQFVGIGNEQFSFLQELDTLPGRLIDNANFFKISNLSKCSDNELYDLLMSEFPDWLPLAKQNNLIA